MESDEVLRTNDFNRAKKYLHSRMNDEMRYETPHYVLPGYNLHARDDTLCYNAESVAEIYTPYPYNCDLPKPLLPGAPLNRTGKKRSLFFLYFCFFFKLSN